MYEYNKLKYCPKCAGKLELKKVDDRKRLICYKCGYIIYRNPIPGTSMIISQKGKILLVKRKEDPRIGCWSLPGGFIEYDETPERAVVREVYEETGYKAKIKELVGVYFYTKKVMVHAIGPTYFGIIVGSRLRKNAEIKWFDPKKLPKKFAYPDQLRGIRDWRKKYGK